MTIEEIKQHFLNEFKELSKVFIVYPISVIEAQILGNSLLEKAGVYIYFKNNE